MVMTMNNSLISNDEFETFDEPVEVNSNDLLISSREEMMEYLKSQRIPSKSSRATKKKRKKRKK